MFNYDWAVLIGRFQPCTKAHLENLLKALTIAERVIVIVGRDALEERSFKDPFIYSEREGLIYSNVPHDLRSRVYVTYVNNVPANNEFWAMAVKNTVRSIQITHPGRGVHGSVCLVGHKKDESTFYLDLFPEWKLIDTGNPTGINATDIRLNYFSNHSGQGWMDGVPPATVEFLSKFRKTKEWYVLHGLYLYELSKNAT